MKAGLSQRLTRLVMVMMFVAVIHSRAATYFVFVDGSGFSPSLLTIEVGDTVVWVNDDDTFPHTTTSFLSIFHPEYWNGIMYDQNDYYVKTFNTLGTFDYYDQVDFGIGFIIVADPAPTGILLESPRIVANQFLFDATGLTAGRTNVLESSTNVINWTSISTNVAPDITMTFTNAPASACRFFRLFEIQ